jgi:uracil-DNA glycosylase
LSAHRGFLGCRHFSKANAWLERMGREPVQWQLPAQAVA